MPNSNDHFIDDDKHYQGMKDVITPNPPCILVVDDNDDDYQWMKDILTTKVPCFVKRASSGEETLEILMKNNDVKLILLDIELEKHKLAVEGKAAMNGFEACRRIKELHGYVNTPVVMITGRYISEFDRRRSLNVGAELFLLKSDSTEDLIKKVKMKLGLKA